MQNLQATILKDDQFVLDEVEKLRVFYALKTEIRYGLIREEEIDTESVAEHIYGMLMLARYFLPLEDPEGKLDRQKVDDLILYHDIDEIETGDTIGYLKTTEHRSVEIEATERVIQRSPESLHARIRPLLAEYFEQETPESHFVRALDKFEPVIQLYCENGKETCLRNNTTFEQGMRIKFPILNDFPYMLRFTEVASAEMNRKGFFTPELPL